MRAVIVYSELRRAARVLKEWSYAGFAMDPASVLFAHLSVGVFGDSLSDQDAQYVPRIDELAPAKLRFSSDRVLLVRSVKRLQNSLADSSRSLFLSSSLLIPAPRQKC